MTAGQDGFRDVSSKHLGGVMRRWIARSVSRLGSLDPTICSFSCMLDINEIGETIPRRFRQSCSR
jgi:hypothetical protein